MMRPSSDKPDKPNVNWNDHDHAGEAASERVFDDELIDESESDIRRKLPPTIVPFVWGAAAFAGAVAVGLVLRSRRRKARWPALLHVTIATEPAPARSAMLSTVGGALARFVFQRLMAAQRDALAGLERDFDARGWKPETGPTARATSSAGNGHQRA